MTVREGSPWGAPTSRRLPVMEWTYPFRQRTVTCWLKTGSPSHSWRKVNSSPSRPSSSP